MGLSSRRGGGGVQNAGPEKAGPSFQELSSAAKEANMAVIYGYPEVDHSTGGDIYYNSAQLIDRDGTSLVNFRKVHLWIDEDGHEGVFTPRKEFVEVVECYGMKIGLLICYDIEFPEAARTLALPLRLAIYCS